MAEEKPDEIRQEIESTRESLAEKVEKIEEQVKGTIGNVTQTVENITETVKEKVQDTVQSVTATVEETVSTVKRTFDIPYQVQRHPWAMAGGALLAGVAAGYFLAGRRGPLGVGFPGGWGEGPSRPAPRSDYQPAASASQPAAAPNYQAARAEADQPGVLARMLGPFESEVNKVKEVAVGALMGMLRDFLKRSLPPTLAANVDEIMNSATRKAGGQPVSGPVLPEGSGTASGAPRTAGHTY